MHWEFFLQKEGEQIWHPIESSRIELEEGKYCLIAHSHRSNLAVEVRITYQPFDLDFNSSHRQTYSRRTNSQGVIKVFPYQYLQAGTWEIRCYGDIMTELLGDHWQKIIQLCVASSSFSSLPKTTVEDYLEQLEQLLRYQIEPLLQVSPTSFVAEIPQLELFLDEDTLITNPEESIVVLGRIEIPEDLETICFQGKIRYELRKFKKGEVIFTFEHSLLDVTLPVDFQHTLLLPDETTIPLLFGEVFLETANGEVLAKQSFSIITQETVTNPVNYTIKLADLNTNSSFTFDFSVEEKATRNTLDLPEPEKMQKALHLYSAAVNPILPPKIATSVPSVPVKKTLQLPIIREGVRQH